MQTKTNNVNKWHQKCAASFPHVMKCGRSASLPSRNKSPFSFFFLKLYKSGLSEIKYFQNELTNVEMKFISLDISLRGKNTELISDVVSEFSKTERNFILNKGQTTVEIERGKLDNEVINNAVSSFSKFVEVINN